MAGTSSARAVALDRSDSDADRSLILHFANTIDVEAGTDELVTRAHLAEFLQKVGATEGRASAREEHVAVARELREAIRRALQRNHDEVGADVPELDRALGRLPLRLSWSAGSPRLVPAEGGVAGGLARIAVAVANLHDDGSWERLKICADSQCQEAYFDASKNRSKNWCGATCGNKAKTRAYRARTKTSRD